MSDGPTKLAPPEALPLDDIILGEDEPVAPKAAPAVAPVASVDAGSSRSSVRPKEQRPAPRPREGALLEAAPVDAFGKTGEVPVVKDDAKDSSSRERKRAKLTLRIPDDEVSRPTLPSVETPAAGIPALLGAVAASSSSSSSPALAAADRRSRPASAPETEVAGVPVVPRPSSTKVKVASTPDETVELPPEELRARMAMIGAGEPSQRALGIDASHEPGWTPYQPPVAEQDGRRSSHAFEEATPGVQKAAAPVLDLVEEVVEEASPASEDIPVDTDDEPIDDGVDDAAVTHPRLPTVLDSEEIRLEESDRVTDPGEEISTDDLVSVESLPTPGPPPPPRGSKPNKPATSGPAVTATALMAGAAQASLPPVASSADSVGAAAGALSAGVAPAPAGSQPSSPGHPSPVAGPAAPAAPSSGPTLGASPAAPARAPGVARRMPSAPQVIVPPVGALAPPPMNETAANRKKIRPWWEDLFNDDFIRTMAKITDGQIAKEVDFIEESLGCEGGAMILDLACGTGRHAVEMAIRGYQVVGFDLSLSMLARASDEAQDRKQKLNFVQGDMREMTFEETFDGIYSWNTSFGYFDEEKNAAVVARVHRALKKGGQFLLDVVNRDSVIRQSPSLAWYEGDGCICMDEMQVDFITSRMKVKRTLMMDDGRTKEIEYSIRIYSLHELGKLLHDNGFRVAEVSGRTGTPGVFFGCESPRTLILAEKR